MIQWVLLAGFTSLWIAGMTLYRGQAIRGGYVNPWLIGAVLMAVVAAGLWFEQKWAKWLGIAVLLAMALNTVGGLFVRGFAWLPAAAVGVLVWLAWDLWRVPVGWSQSDEEDEPSLSLVLLFQEPVYLEPAILAQMASRAWGAEVHVGVEDDAEGEENVGDSEEGIRSFLIGESPHFLCSHWPAFLAINNFDEPYFGDAEEIARSVGEMRVRRAIEQHRAWVSVDLLHWFGEEGDEEQAYRMIARLLAELADDNCLAIIDTGEGRLFAYDPETEAKLRSENPLKGLRDWYYAPILTIAGDDPEMAAAVEEARRRWPEFVAAFEQRSDDEAEPYLIKAPFIDGDNTEFMWVGVTGIENDIIYGKLENSPANVKTVDEGDTVRVKVEDLNDWMCVINDTPTGAFTLKVLSERNRGES